MARPTLDAYYVKMLQLVASRATCARRQVGAIITDVKGQVLSTGYNGVPSGVEHCLDFPCPGATDPPGDTRRCSAVHAEQNAIMQCSNIQRAHTIYCSAFPCFTCTKMLLNTPIQRIVYVEEYADTNGLLLLAMKKVSYERYYPDATG